MTTRSIESLATQTRQRDAGGRMPRRDQALRHGRGDACRPCAASIWNVHHGEMTLLVGPSGCGKTTLLSVIAGILDPTRARSTCSARTCDELGGRQSVRFRGKNIGFVFQQYNLLPALTAAENAAVPLLIAGWTEAKARSRRPRRCWSGSGMGDRRPTPCRPSSPAGSSSGWPSRGRWSTSRSLLVCDEPTAALDAETGQTVMELLRRRPSGPIARWSS